MAYMEKCFQVSSAFACVCTYILMIPQMTLTICKMEYILMFCLLDVHLGYQYAYRCGTEKFKQSS